MASESGFYDDEYELFERLSISRDDLQEARSYVEVILKQRYFRSRPFAVPASAFYTAFIVSYSRPFSSNKDRRGGRVGKVLAPFLDRLGEKERLLHDEILAERNRLIAHSDGSVRRLQLHGSSSAISFSTHSGLRGAIGSEERFFRILRLIERLIGELAQEIERLEPLQREKADRHGSYPPGN